MSPRGGGAAAERGAARHAVTERAFREAWHRLEAGTPVHPDLRDHEWQLSVSAICVEARRSRNALYEGHPDLLQEIKAAIAKQGQVADRTRRATSLETALAACRIERQRLVAENAALLLRAVTAEDALIRLQRRQPRALKMTDDRPDAS